MKRIFCIISLVLFLSGCHPGAVAKPDHLIDEDTMVDILYDLSIIDAIKAQNAYAPQNQSINPKEYIFKKYKTDSLQFTESNRYYVAQIEQYKKMYEKVAERIEQEKKIANPPQPAIEKPTKKATSEAGQVQ